MYEEKEHKINYHLEGPLYLVGGKKAEEFIDIREKKKRKLNEEFRSLSDDLA
jgi:hypothetical protein